MASSIFPSNQPSAFLDIGIVQLIFGCLGSTYPSNYDSTVAPGGQTKAVFNDTAQPCFSGASDPDNKAALDALSAKFGADFLGWIQTQFDYNLVGIVNIQPNGFIDEIEIDYNSDVASTRIRSTPWNGWPHELGHEDPSCPSGQGLGLMIGVTTGIITARSGTTFGFGTVQVYAVSSPTAATAGSTITVKNWYSSQIQSGKYCLIGRIGCTYFYLAGDC